MKPIKLPEMRWITKLMTRTNQGPGATIMDRTSIIIKNDTTTMINNLATCVGPGCHLSSLVVFLGRFLVIPPSLVWVADLASRYNSRILLVR
jgi:hypothetical protein